MTDKLEFHFDDTPALVYDMKPLKNKLTAKIKCGIALDILEKLTLEELATYFTTLFNEMVQIKLDEHAKSQTPVNDDKSEPDIA